MGTAVTLGGQAQARVGSSRNAPEPAPWDPRRPRCRIVSTKQEVDDVIASYKAGESVTHVPKRFSLNRKTVTGYLVKFGVEIREVQMTDLQID
jgi:hypothetical protein